jgi:putative membrane-bound dehydrogenase-like protein
MASLIVMTSLLILTGSRSRAADPPKPIKALLVTGGCCHDYEKQKKILTEGISARAPVEWTIVQQGGSTTNTKIPLYENPDWAKGFDIVVHNECFAEVTDPEWTERILKPHRAGIPAVVIHCAMHCYRDKTDEWFKFLGVTSHGHGANYPFEVFNIAKDNPIMEHFGASWNTPKGELYLISKVWDTATPLAQAHSRDSKKDEVCIWTNMFDKTRVFGTTLGHHNEEMRNPVYLDFMTRGLLWAVDKLDEDHFIPAEKRVEKKVRVPENLALHKPATASSFQDGDRKPEAAVDGDIDTRWCANGPSAPQWWQVDLGKPQELTGCRIVWEMDGAAYRYTVEGSSDEKAWMTLVDQSKGDETGQGGVHPFAAKGIRYLRVNVNGLSAGSWASFFEFEAHGTKTVEVSAEEAGLDRPRPIGGKGLLAGIKAPAGFDVTLFAAPPDVRYPTCLAAAPTGEVFVGIDENGSLDAKENRGRVVRCLDLNRDGTADHFNVFATMDSPRGLCYDDDTLYVLHPPTLSAYHDDDGDGAADRSETLVEGIGFGLKFRGADHTTNGIRLGIDGWIYVAVGDYGFVDAKGTDGAHAQLLGGGVVRVRPDGSGLEIVSRGQRNIYDVAIDPEMNLFTRDNTNDGGGWDVRLSHVVPTGHYGYPSLFKNFGDEIIQPLADYGGGSPTGSVFVQEPGFPEGFGNTLYTCEWGRNTVDRHPLTAKGAGFTAEKKTFLEIPRPTDIDVDGRSHLFISTWNGGGFTYDKPDVGYVIRVRQTDTHAPAFPDLEVATDEQLLRHLISASHVLRLSTQREIVRRNHPEAAAGLEALASADGPLAPRVAAIFGLELLLKVKSINPLVKLSQIDAVREFALRALGDRKEDAAKIPAEPFIQALKDQDPRVRLQAVIALGRLGKREAAKGVLERTADGDPLVAHVAVRSLVNMHAAGVCLAALGRSDATLAPGAARALGQMHEKAVVDGLIKLLDDKDDDEDSAIRRPILAALCRLYYREDAYKGDWWGTRPDNSGPYYKPVSWSETERIGAAIREALDDAEEEELGPLLAELARNKIDFDEATARAIDLAKSDPKARAVTLDLFLRRSKLSTAGLKFLADAAVDQSLDSALRVRVLRRLMRESERPEAFAAAIRAFSTIRADGKSSDELLGLWQEFTREHGNAEHLEKFRELANDGDPGRSELGFGVLLQLADDATISAAARDAARQAIESAWNAKVIPPTLLRAVGRTVAERYAFQVGRLRKDANPDVSQAAEFAAKRLDLDALAHRNVNPADAIASKTFEQIVDEVNKTKQKNAALGARLFARQGCAACHTVSPGEVPKGPPLAGISTRYSKPELIESILKPSAKIAQGFEPQKFADVDGRTYQGFVVRESGDEVEFRDANGVSTVLPKSQIEERVNGDVSIMPTGLVDPLTVPELAAILDYLESLKAN